MATSKVKVGLTPGYAAHAEPLQGSNLKLPEVVEKLYMLWDRSHGTEGRSFTDSLSYLTRQGLGYSINQKMGKGPEHEQLIYNENEGSLQAAGCILSKMVVVESNDGA